MPNICEKCKRPKCTYEHAEDDITGKSDPDICHGHSPSAEGKVKPTPLVVKDGFASGGQYPQVAKEEGKDAVGVAKELLTHLNERVYREFKKHGKTMDASTFAACVGAKMKDCVEQHLSLTRDKTLDEAIGVVEKRKNWGCPCPHEHGKDCGIWCRNMDAAIDGLRELKGKKE